MDKRVEIHGTSRADINGQRGVATDFHYYREDQSKWRYTVQLDSGEAFKLKPTNVRAEGSVRNSAQRKIAYSRDQSFRPPKWPPLVPMLVWGGLEVY